MRSTLLAVLVLVSAFPAAANACQYAEPPTLRSALKEATNVFVFRLDQATYKREELGAGAYTAWVEGTIRPVQNLYGSDPARFRHIKFPATWCGAVTLVVGHHYLIATRASGDTIELAMADESILDIEGRYNPSDKRRSLKSPLILPVIKAIYRGEELPDSYPPTDILSRTVVVPPPPPK